jgi:hypothetical protein
MTHPQQQEQEQVQEQVQPHSAMLLLLSLALLLVLLPLLALPVAGFAYLTAPRPLTPTDDAVLAASAVRSSAQDQYEAVRRSLTDVGLTEVAHQGLTIRCITDPKSRWSFWDTTSWCVSEGRTVLATPPQDRPFSVQDAGDVHATLMAQGAQCEHPGQPVHSYLITCSTAGVTTLRIEIHGAGTGFGISASDPWARPGLQGLPHTGGQVPVVLSYSRTFIDQSAQ